MKLTNLTKKYGNRTVLDIPEFSFERGVRYAIVGANGSGKSTLIKVLCKAIKPDSGKVEYCDKPRIAYMPQKNFGFDMSLFHNLTFVTKNKEEAKEMMEAFELSHLKNKNGARLSGGETQRMCLARALLTDFDMLFLDEPTAAMDINSAKKAEDIISQKIVPDKKTLIFATHSVFQAQKLADYIIFMHEGSIVEVSPACDFLDAKEEKTKAFLQYFVGLENHANTQSDI